MLQNLKNDMHSFDQRKNSVTLYALGPSKNVTWTVTIKWSQRDQCRGWTVH